MIVYLKCVDNNRAASVFDAFIAAVCVHGLPSHVRSDLGGENMEVWRYMVEEHSSDSAVITGSSTHNQRIERMWRDYFQSVGVHFSDTFRMLEDDGKLLLLTHGTITPFPLKETILQTSCLFEGQRSATSSPSIQILYHNSNQQQLVTILLMLSQFPYEL